MILFVQHDDAKSYCKGTWIKDNQGDKTLHFTLTEVSIKVKQEQESLLKK